MGKFTTHLKSQKKLIYATLLVPLGFFTGCSRASDVSVSHITILRETLFERGVPVDPNGIALTRDGGLIVAGSLGGSQGWATRISPAGVVVWRYLVPGASDTS